jgi:hypothetical protein
VFLTSCTWAWRENPSYSCLQCDSRTGHSLTLSNGVWRKHLKFCESKIKLCIVFFSTSTYCTTNGLHSRLFFGKTWTRSRRPVLDFSVYDQKGAICYHFKCCGVIGLVCWGVLSYSTLEAVYPPAHRISTIELHTHLGIIGASEPLEGIGTLWDVDVSSLVKLLLWWSRSDYDGLLIDCFTAFATVLCVRCDYTYWNTFSQRFQVSMNKWRSALPMRNVPAFENPFQNPLPNKANEATWQLSYISSQYVKHNVPCRICKLGSIPCVDWRGQTCDKREVRRRRYDYSRGGKYVDCDGSVSKNSSASSWTSQ